MSDLVDYLRLRLAHTTDAVCRCPDVEISSTEDLRRHERVFVKGHADDCPVHGFEGTEPTYRRRRP